MPCRLAWPIESGRDALQLELARNLRTGRRDQGIVERRPGRVGFGPARVQTAACLCRLVQQTRNWWPVGHWRVLFGTTFSVDRARTIRSKACFSRPIRKLLLAWDSLSDTIYVKGQPTSTRHLAGAGLAGPWPTSTWTFHWQFIREFSTVRTCRPMVPKVTAAVLMSRSPGSSPEPRA